VVLGLLGELSYLPAWTDSATMALVLVGCVGVGDEAFFARGPIATAGGCMAAPYLAAWLMWRGAGEAAAAQALHHVAPVGEKDAWVERVLKVVRPFAAAA
jgi:hypothetical protein